MALMIYNTLTRKKEEFKPIEPGKVRMYVCGMTVYDYCHLGHARVLVAFDVITRYLRARGYDVNYVRNITDIDDKILKRAAEHPELYGSYKDLTKKFIDEMHLDEKRLGIEPPNNEPQVTDYIDQIQAMIRKLIDKGYAYEATNGDVYYSVSKFKNYGQLSGKKPDELLAGARIEIEEAKHDPRDFALWKAADQGEEGVWGSLSGEGFGRPGWHIECSAMSTHCLGETFDIHGGGPDLKFPHHENEIAQSEAATGKHYVNYWMHAGAVRVDGEKMSKSLGNFFTIRQILDKFDEVKGPQLIRYLLISTHYRSAIDYSQESLIKAEEALERFNLALRNFDDVPAANFALLVGNKYYERFVEAMDDDFNTPLALSVMFDLIVEINASQDAREATEKVSILRALGGVLGILKSKSAKLFVQGLSVRMSLGGVDIRSSQAAITPATIDVLIRERIESKKSKNFARADEIRKELLAQGIVLEDRKDGTTDWRRE